MNLRVETIRTLALRLVDADLVRDGLRLLSRAQALALVEQACGEFLKADGYFAALRDRPGFHRALQRTFEELRGAGIPAADLPADAFADRRKREELRRHPRSVRGDALRLLAGWIARTSFAARSRPHGRAGGCRARSCTSRPATWISRASTARFSSGSPTAASRRSRRSRRTRGSAKAARRRAVPRDRRGERDPRGVPARARGTDPLRRRRDRRDGLATLRGARLRARARARRALHVLGGYRCGVHASRPVRPRVPGLDRRRLRRGLAPTCSLAPRR